LADVKISALPASTTPLAGTEILPIVQSSTTKQVSVANLTAGRAVSALSYTATGNLTFTGTGNRITGDFTNATTTNQVAFQTTTANSNTNVNAIPSGTGVLSGFRAFNNSDPTNAGYIDITVSTTQARLRAGITGTGTYLPITFATNNAEAMRIDTTGNVGIGTSSPLVNLDVVNSSAPGTGAVTTVRLNHAGTSAGDGPRLLFTSGTSTTGGCAIAGYGTALNAADMLFYAGGNTERMRIDSSGNLGLGTSSPSSRLSVTGSANIATFDGGSATSISLTGSSRSDLFLIDSGAATDQKRLTIRGDDGNLIFGVENDAVTTFTERMRIDSSGNVLIGTTSSVAPLTVDKSVSNNNIAFIRNSNTTAGTSFGLKVAAGTNSSDYAFGIDNAASSVALMRVYGDGSLNVSGIVTMSAYGAGAATFSAAGVISSVSDETWKIKDGVPINTDAMLQKLEPGYWFYNEEKAPTFGEERQLGFYAQNVHEAIGEEAAPTPEEGKPWGYYDRSVLAIAVMSLKTALNTIEELKQRIATLENK
jgi:hypothetical protein